LVALGADLLDRFGIDQFLHRQPHGVANQIDTPAGAEGIQQFTQDRL
jgi:hypothetical protein